MKVNNRRSDIQIIADMLRLGEACKTEIMYSANMSYFQLQKYLKFLLQQKLVDKVYLGNPSVSYRVTEKGFALLRHIDSIQQLLESDDEDAPAPTFVSSNGSKEKK